MMLSLIWTEVDDPGKIQHETNWSEKQLPRGVFKAPGQLMARDG